MKLANHITKIPNCRKSGLFSGKWLTIKVVTLLWKAARKTISNWQDSQHTADWCSFVSVFQFLVGTTIIFKVIVTDGKTWQRETQLCVIYIVRLISWLQQASFEKIQLFSLDGDGVNESGIKKRKMMTVVVSLKWQPAAPSLWAINLRGILIIHNWS